MTDHAASLWVWDGAKQMWVCGCGAEHPDVHVIELDRRFKAQERAKDEESLRHIIGWNRAIDELRGGDQATKGKKEPERERPEPESGSEPFLRFESGEWGDPAEPQIVRSARSNT